MNELRTEKKERIQILKNERIRENKKKKRNEEHKRSEKKRKKFQMSNKMATRDKIRKALNEVTPLKCPHLN